MTETIGYKTDESKTRMDLVPAYPLRQVAEVMTFGATKYGDNNWREGMDWHRLFGALQRHSWAFWGGEDLDPETGLEHMAHAAFNCLALVEMMRTHRELDDRPKPSVKQKTLEDALLDHVLKHNPTQDDDEKFRKWAHGFDAIVHQSWKVPPEIAAKVLGSEPSIPPPSVGGFNPLSPSLPGPPCPKS